MIELIDTTNDKFMSKNEAVRIMPGGLHYLWEENEVILQ